MASVQFANTAFALIPPLLAIVLAVLTRRVLISLGAGIVLGILMHNQFNLLAAFQDLSTRALGLFWSDGSLDSWNVPLLGFLLVLGMTIALTTVTGGTKSFAQWARQRVKTRRHARIMTFFLGLVVFIDDYFSSLAVGAVSKPVADDHQVSREELSYMLDCTAGPVCVISPISSWGAYTMGLLGSIFTARHIEMGPFTVFVKMIPMNFYAIFALLMLAGVVYFNLNFGSMAKAAERAKNEGKLWDETRGTPPGVKLDLPVSDHGSVWSLTLPIITLVLGSIFFMLQTGGAALAADNKAFTVIGALEETATTLALFYASVLSLSVSIIMAFRQKLAASITMSALFSGMKSMLPAVYILLFAWTIAGVVGDLGTGKYLASLVQTTMPMWLLPLLIFILSGIAAFSTGTSWGTFAIMLPIAADIALASDATMLLPLMAAVLSGSVLGDHCSPISDTTVLSSTGASCHHIDHVTTQLPFAVTVAIIAATGYLAVGLTSSILVGFVVCSALLIGFMAYARKNLQMLDPA